MMQARQEYQLTQQDLDTLRDASKPVPYMIIGGVMPRTPQENANAAWQRMGEKYDFVWDTAQPLSNSNGRRLITAVPMEDKK